MEYIPGRRNLAATIHVPAQCSNNCKFCVNKDFYERGTKPDEILKVCKALNDTPLKDIVITGGEPTNDLKYLEEMLDTFSIDKRVYINTSLPKENFDLFNQLLYRHNVACVNISRHAERFEDEFLKNISPDDYIKLLPCPVRVNVFVSKGMNIKAVCERWKKMPVRIGFRNDFTKMEEKNLHSCVLNDLPEYLRKINFIGKEQCPACDTLYFQNETNMITWHKGLRYTSRDICSTAIEINDIVVYPDGRICYDWDYDKELDLDKIDFSNIEKRPACV